MKISTKFYFLALLLIISILTGCQTNEPEEIEEAKQPRQIFELDLILGFMPNTKPEITHSLLSPNPGLRGYLRGEIIELEARNTTKFSFYKWEIKTHPNTTKEIYKQNHTINMTQNHTIIAYFGCNQDSACEKDYLCKQGICVMPETRPTPSFGLAYSDIGNKTDKDKLQKVKQELINDRYTITTNPLLFNEVNATRINNQVFLAIIDTNAIIITNIEPTKQQTELKEKIKEILENIGFEETKIKAITTNQIKTHDLHDLFFT